MNLHENIVPEQAHCKEETYVGVPFRRAAESMIETFRRKIESGAMQKFGDIGLPCSGLPTNVIESIGLDSKDRGTGEADSRLFFFGNDGPVSSENAAGLKFGSKKTPGSFPKKSASREPCVYIFQSAKDVLKARHVWKSSGLGNLPAYAFTGFPAPDSFSGTETFVFVSLPETTWDPDFLSEAIAAHGKAVKLSKCAGLTPDGLRDLIFIRRPEGLFPVPEMKQAGETRDGAKVFFSEHGYFMDVPGKHKPVQATNFAFRPRLAYSSDFPSVMEIMVGDLYVDGKLRNEKLVLHGDRGYAFERMYSAAKTMVGGDMLKIFRRDGMRDCVFDVSCAENTTFPGIPCVFGPGTVVFPSFRLENGKIIQHAHLTPLFLSRHQNLPYKAVTPNTPSRSDVKELSKLFSFNSESAKAVALGICSWLHMVVSSMLHVRHGLSSTKLCFELHSPGNEAEKAMSFLSLLFSGDPAAHNDIGADKRSRVNKLTGMSAEYGSVEKLPMFFDVDMNRPEIVRMSAYRKTECHGVYLVRHSELDYPMNMAGNASFAVVVEKPGGLPEVSVKAIRRVVTGILLKYSQMLDKIDLDKWMSANPVLKMHDYVCRVLSEAGIPPPGRKWFSGMELKGKR